MGECQEDESEYMEGLTGRLAPFSSCETIIILLVRGAVTAINKVHFTFKIVIRRKWFKTAIMHPINFIITSLILLSFLRHLTAAEENADPAEYISPRILQADMHYLGSKFT